MMRRSLSACERQASPRDSSFLTHDTEGIRARPSVHVASYPLFQTVWSLVHRLAFSIHSPFARQPRTPEDMKTTALLLAVNLAAVAADPLPSLVSTAVVVNSTESAVAPGKNSTGHGFQIQRTVWQCSQPSGAPRLWYRLTKNDGPHDCHVPPLTSEWSMLRSYRDGGVQNVHWKYTDNENDPECMSDWTYHAADGKTVKARVSGRTTTYGLNRRWCGLPVYNDGGVQGYQWEYCSCRDRDIGRPGDRD